MITLKTRGKPCNIDRPIVGRVTRNILNQNQGYIFLSNEETLPGDYEWKAVLTCNNVSNSFENLPQVFNIITLEHLKENDIVVINEDGVINTLYRVNSYQNFILVTERCNSNCLMCSQPPKNKNDIDYLFGLYEQLIPLIPKDCCELGITGGEPTLLGNKFFELIRLIKKQLPDTEVHCLTNGRSFAWQNVAEKLGDVDNRRLMLGIPLYSDYYQIHDYVVQAKNAFNQTVQGLYNLATYNQRIEIRVVLHKQTIPRLVKLGYFIYKNLPFVEHIAFMGLEYQGYTPYNIEKLWIDPAEYMHELEETVEFLSARGLNVSIYNLQLCLLPKSLWKFNKKSISDWKNIYVDECDGCSLKNDCGGFFASNLKMHSKYLKAFV